MANSPGDPRIDARLDLIADMVINETTSAVVRNLDDTVQKKVRAAMVAYLEISGDAELIRISQSQPKMTAIRAALNILNAQLGGNHV